MHVKHVNQCYISHNPDITGEAILQHIAHMGASCHT